MQPNIEHAVHVVWPDYTAYPVEGTFQKTLARTFLKILRYTSDVLQAISMAIPALSLGVLRTPSLTIVSTIYSALKEYTAELLRHETTPTLRTVHFVSDHLGNTGDFAYALFQLRDAEPTLTPPDALTPGRKANHGGG